MSRDKGDKASPRTTPQSRHRVGWSWRGWLEQLSLSSGPDVMALLVDQGRVSLEALEAFEAWSSSGADDQARRVSDLEHRADDARHALVAALKSSLATPVGQEDLFVLSERCDRVVNRAKNIVKEAETLGWSPDGHAARMAGQLHAGMQSVVTGFKTLDTRANETSDAAIKATHCVRNVEHSYRHAMAELVAQPDLRQVFTAREMYRFYARAAEALEGLADRLWFAVLSEP